MADLNSKPESLFNEFYAVSTEEWEEILTRDLKGADYKEKLRWESIEGISVLPFYRKENLEDLPHIQHKIDVETPANWSVCEPIDASDPAEANRQAKEAVGSGANSLWITLQMDADEGMLGGDITGTHVQNLADLKTLLDGIDLQKTGIVFDSGAGSPGVLGLVKSFLKSSVESSPDSADAKSTPFEGGQVSLLFDPFTFMAQRGRLPLPEDQLNSIIEQMVSEKWCMALAANGAFYHNCGATIVQELGIALAIGSEFLARVPESNREMAARQFWMHLSAGSLYFPEIAKLRAARLLWNRVLDGYEINERQPLTIHSSTSTWNKAIADPHNNMLRATTEATSAAVGGANRITIHPYNAHFEKPDTFSRRIARNVNHILDEEVHLSMVENPADGSYYIEVLTDEIAKKAWKFFQLIEKQGGFQKAIEGKIIQGEIGRSRLEKDRALATRKLSMTGVNITPDPEQELPKELYRSIPVDSLQQSGAEPEIDPDKLIESLSNALGDGATLGDVVGSFLQPQKQLYPALKPYRAAQRFEEIRLATQTFEQKRGKNIKVQLVPVGDPKMRKARATFSRNFLGCAGFEIDNPLGYETIEEAAVDLSNSEADIFVLCGSDETYPDLVKPFCDHFGNGSLTILAGNPKEHSDQYKEAGINFFIYMGVNMIEVLEEIQEKIGIDSE
ncbi:MAG: methylmalonyl-CoA mutase family protein [Bacteroidota bacterium]